MGSRAVIQQPVHCLCRGKIHHCICLHIAVCKRSKHRIAIVLCVVDINTSHDLQIFHILCQGGDHLSHGTIAAVHDDLYHLYNLPFSSEARFTGCRMQS